jgi:hypothetical protein
MAGSYAHIVHSESGRLLPPEEISDILDTSGDVYETIEQLYGMIWFLAGGNAESVAAAQASYQIGLVNSPGVGPAPTGFS